MRECVRFYNAWRQFPGKKRVKWKIAKDEKKGGRIWWRKESDAHRMFTVQIFTSFVLTRKESLCKKITIPKAYFNFSSLLISVTEVSRSWRSWEWARAVSLISHRTWNFGAEFREDAARQMLMWLKCRGFEKESWQKHNEVCNGHKSEKGYG